MKLFLIIFIVLTIIKLYSAADEEIVLYENGADERSYDFKFETSDGIARIEKGELKPDSNGGADILSVEGTYVYLDNDGTEHKVSYKADENGYRVLP